MVEIRDTSSRGHTLPGDLCQWFAALNPALAFSMIWRGIRGHTLPVAAPVPQPTIVRPLLVRPRLSLGTRIKKGSRTTQGSLRALLILTSRLGSLVDVLTFRLGTRFQEHCIPLLGSVSFLGIRFRISARASKAISQDLSMNSSPRGVELISFLISD